MILPRRRRGPCRSAPGPELSLPAFREPRFEEGVRGGVLHGEPRRAETSGNRPVKVFMRRTFRVSPRSSWAAAA